MKVDFFSFHHYQAPNPNSKYHIQVKWCNDVLEKPYIIGEVGFSAHDSTLCTVIHGSEAQQSNYAFNTLNHTFNCNGKGYTWWRYHDVIPIMTLIDRQSSPYKICF